MRIGMILLLTIMFTGYSIAQDNAESVNNSESPTQIHVHVESPQLVDGALHPELVPDSTAYRLFFLALTAECDTCTSPLLRETLGSKTVLNSSDIDVVASTLSDFKVQYAAFLKTYNEAANNALKEGLAPDYLQLTRQRDSIVQSARDRLRQSLTSQGLAALDSLVQAEKRHMKVLPNATTAEQEVAR